MFKDFLTALTQRILGFLKNHPEFFEKKDRKAMLEKLAVPTSFKSYMAEVSEKEFIKDLSLILDFCKNPKKTQIKKNEFFKALLEFLVQELSMKIDYLDGNYYLLPREDREKVIEKLINTKSTLAETLRAILINKNYQQLTAEINRLAGKIIETPFLIVQSPREMNMELKREIRQTLSKDHPYSLPVFQINKKLIGGIRIFKDGEVQDHSWLSRVEYFTSLTAA